MPRTRLILFRALALALVLVPAWLLLETSLFLRERLVARRLAGLADYRDTWRDGGLGPGGYLLESFDRQVLGGDGRPVRWHNNAQGFRHDRPTSALPGDGVLRILSLGDSFTAGYRVGQDETFSYLLEQRAAALAGVDAAEVLISVIEQPTAGLDYLERYGLQLDPDLVLLGLTLGNDLVQTWGSLHPAGTYRWQGSQLRLNPAADASTIESIARQTALPKACLTDQPPVGEGTLALTLKAGPTPSIRWLRSLRTAALERRRGSAIVSTWPNIEGPRLFDSNGLGIFLIEPPTEIEQAWDELRRVLAAYQRLTREAGIELVVVLFPQRYQVQALDWRRTVEVYGLQPTCFDLQLPNRRLAEITAQLDLRLLDPTASLRARFSATGDPLYLPRGDMHWNAAGHRALAAAIWPDLALLFADREAPSPDTAAAPPLLYD